VRELTGRAAAGQQKLAASNPTVCGASGHLAASWHCIVRCIAIGLLRAFGRMEVVHIDNGRLFVALASFPNTSPLLTQHRYFLRRAREISPCQLTSAASADIKPKFARSGARA